MTKLPQLDLDSPVQPRLDANGHEILDETPIAIPAGFKKPLTLEERIKRLVRSERLAQSAENQGFETFEEADDFDIPDDTDPLEHMFNSPTQYEANFDSDIETPAKASKFVQEEPSARKAPTPAASPESASGSNHIERDDAESEAPEEPRPSRRRK